MHIDNGVASFGHRYAGQHGFKALRRERQNNRIGWLNDNARLRELQVSHQIIAGLHCLQTMRKSDIRPQRSEPFQRRVNQAGRKPLSRNERPARCRAMGEGFRQHLP